MTRRRALQINGITVGVGLVSGSSATEQSTSKKFRGGEERGPISLVYDVTRFGASGDGESDDSEAIQTAIDTAVSQGDGIVPLSKGTCAVDETLDITGEYIAVDGFGQGSIIRGTFEGGDIIYAGGLIQPPGSEIPRFMTSQSMPALIRLQVPPYSASMPSDSPSKMCSLSPRGRSIQASTIGFISGTSIAVYYRTSSPYAPTSALPSPGRQAKRGVPASGSLIGFAS